MKFEEAAELVKKLKQRPSDNELLELYALYKQGSVGDCDTAKPGMFDMKNKYKWESWNAKKGISKEEAQSKYIELVSELVKKYGTN